MSLTNGTLIARRDNKDGLADIKVQFDLDDAYVNGTGSLLFSEFIESIVDAVASASTDKNVRGPEDLTIVDVISSLSSGLFEVKYDMAADALFLYNTNTGAEYASADYSADSIQVTCLCK